MTVISGFNDDTVQTCRDRSNTGDMVEVYISAAMYVNGMGKPHYSVPAIPLNVHLYSDVYIGCMYIEIPFPDYNELVYIYDSWNSEAH